MQKRNGCLNQINYAKLKEKNILFSVHLFTLNYIFDGPLCYRIHNLLTLYAHNNSNVIAE